MFTAYLTNGDNTFRTLSSLGYTSDTNLIFECYPYNRHVTFTQPNLNLLKKTCPMLLLNPWVKLAYNRPKGYIRFFCSSRWLYMTSNIPNWCMHPITWYHSACPRYHLLQWRTASLNFDDKYYCTGIFLKSEIGILFLYMYIDAALLERLYFCVALR